MTKVRVHRFQTSDGASGFVCLAALRLPIRGPRLAPISWSPSVGNECLRQVGDEIIGVLDSD
jgi:hypothetical protein